VLAPSGLATRPSPYAPLAAFRLWNVAIEMSKEGLPVEDLNVRGTNRPLYPTMLAPKLPSNVVRHIACDLLSMAATGLPKDHETFVCSFKFFSRTGKLWSGTG
jgi:hypothetical protein